MNYYPRRNGFQQRGGYGGQPQNNPNDRELKGKAWQNTRATHPKAPHFTGVVNVLGVAYQISVWMNHDPQKGDVLDFKLQPKQEQRRQEFQNGGGYSGYAPQPQQNGYAPQTPVNRQEYAPQRQGGYVPPQPQPNGGNFQANRQENHAPQPQQQSYTANRGHDAPWPGDGAPPPASPDDYGNADPWDA